MTIFSVDPARCEKDDLCLTVCPLRIIRAGADGYPAVTPEREAYCIACGHCAAICPRGAITLRDTPGAALTPLDKTLAVSFEAASQLLKARRSVRHFKPEPLSRAQIVEVLDVTRWAPTGTNTQSLKWTVIDGFSRVRELAGLVVDWMRGVAAADPAMGKRLNLPGVIRAFEEGKDPVCRGAPHVVAVHAGRESVTPAEDAVIGLTYLELAAFARGYGTCWAGFVALGGKSHKPILDFLGIPPEEKLYGAVMLGRPRYRFARLPERKPASVAWR
jgi:nitroreductase/NAD-dependent dihydropyrimidine dehydrogenase PreA subunit